LSFLFLIKNKENFFNIKRLNKKINKKMAAHDSVKMGRGKEIKESFGTYRLANDEDFDLFCAFIEETKSWRKMHYDEKTKATVFTKESDNVAINIFKLTVPMPDVAPEVLYDVLHDHEYRKVWDDNMVEGIVIHQLDSCNEIGYYHAKSPAIIIQDRDFVNQRAWKSIPERKTHVIMNWSIEHASWPHKRNVVRAQSILSGYHIVSNGKDGCFFTYVTQTDPKGWIPAWVTNNVTGVMAPKLAHKLHEVALKYPAWKRNNNPDWKPWLV
jgi:hypothetical protein